MTALLNALKTGWQTYTVLATVVVGALAFASLPARVSALEKRMDREETVSRYTACVLRAQSRAQDATPCESHLSASVLDYLRPRSE